MGIEDDFTSSRCAAQVIRHIKVQKVSEQTVARDLPIHDAERILHLCVAMAALDPEVNLQDLGDNGDLADVALFLREQGMALDWADLHSTARAAFSRKNGIPPRANMYNVLQAAKLQLARAFPLQTRKKTMDYVTYTQREEAWVRNIRAAGSDRLVSDLELHVIVGSGHLWPLFRHTMQLARMGITQDKAARLDSHQRDVPGPRLLELLPGKLAPYDI